MDPGFYALAGVAVTVLSGGGGAWIQRQWARSDAQNRDRSEREREREARLFDHKMKAYSMLLTVFSEFSTGLFDWNDRVLRDPPPTRSAIVPLLDAVDLARIFGSAKVGQAAQELVTRCMDLIEASSSDRLDYLRETMLADEALTNAIREDLGTGDPLPTRYPDFTGDS